MPTFLRPFLSIRHKADCIALSVAWQNVKQYGDNVCQLIPRILLGTEYWFEE